MFKWLFFIVLALMVFFLVFIGKKIVDRTIEWPKDGSKIDIELKKIPEYWQGKG